jgi:hypothetical protein
MKQVANLHTLLESHEKFSNRSLIIIEGDHLQKVECEEYLVEYYQSHRTLLWVWIMLWGDSGDANCSFHDPWIITNSSSSFLFRFSFSHFLVSSSHFAIVKWIDLYICSKKIGFLSCKVPPPLFVGKRWRQQAWHEWSGVIQNLGPTSTLRYWE